MEKEIATSEEVLDNHDFYRNIKSILAKAKETAYKSINFIMVEATANS